MADIRDMDPESVADLGSFLEAQLEYHNRCREALVQLKAEWPVRYGYLKSFVVHETNASSSTQPQTRSNRPSRSNTARSYTQAYEEAPPPPLPEVRPSIRSNKAPSGRVADIMNSEYANSQSGRPHINRSTTFDPPRQPRRDVSPAGSRPLSRVPSDSLMIRTTKSNLRTIDRSQDRDIFADDTPYSSNSSPDQSYEDASVSPATSTGSGANTPLSKRPPPPPPPSRAKKPPPPPVPQKRTVYT